MIESWKLCCPLCSLSLWSKASENYSLYTPCRMSKFLPQNADTQCTKFHIRALIKDVILLKML